MFLPLEDNPINLICIILYFPEDKRAGQNIAETRRDVVIILPADIFGPSESL
jgi:hypothetical protein